MDDAPPGYSPPSRGRRLNGSCEVDGIPLNNMRPGLESGQEEVSSRSVSQMTLISPSHLCSVSQIVGAGGLARTVHSDRFRIDRDDQRRAQRTRLQKRIQATLEEGAKKFFFLLYFTSNAAMLIRMAIKASNERRMQSDEVLGWTFVQFMMLFVLLVRYVWISIITTDIGLLDSLRIAAATAGTLVLCGWYLIEMAHKWLLGPVDQGRRRRISSEPHGSPQRNDYGKDNTHATIQSFNKR
ncbi:uncharacterized protein Z519_02089 [Cladophialophora bantiana CBS 173.52]|uniref:Uncharacterized protein n=1 Tax=Cladophialophora bantiana (strain ATCC 10958 / CBS 173.52 / CDC B-1940 / NIH 8579) TaxID=1442370 RepID=A0A0D2HTA7_CLAB1|nr:uncharacterized protein Z519_02089 [Cladophialophora bantiana CBS 173.52]KIW96698.1 hypothetical protein Z519_02089 [Cladophialophora bantiana CBS 173.52]